MTQLRTEGHGEKQLSRELSSNQVWFQLTTDSEGEERSCGCSPDGPQSLEAFSSGRLSPSSHVAGRDLGHRHVGVAGG